MGDDLVMADEVPASEHFFYSSVELSLSDLLAFEVRAYSVDKKDQINFFFFLAFDFLHAKIRFQLYFITPGSGPPDFLLLSILTWLDA